MGEGDSDSSDGSDSRFSRQGDPTSYDNATQSSGGGYYSSPQVDANQSAAEVARLLAMAQGENQLANIGVGSTPISDQRNWSIGPNGQVYGNIQNAAADLGINPSQTGASAPAWLAALSPKLAGMLSGLGALQDAGLPGYSMTPEERALAGSFGGSSSARRGYDFGLMTAPQVAQQKTPQELLFGSPFVNSVGLFQNSIPVNSQASYPQQSSILNGLFRGYI